jgi:hypothetical protein
MKEAATVGIDKWATGDSYGYETWPPAQRKEQIKVVSVRRAEENNGPERERERK